MRRIASFQMPIEFINTYFFANLMLSIDSQHLKAPKTVVCRILHHPCNEPGWANVYVSTCLHVSMSTCIFRCVLASLYEGLSVRPSVRPSVCPSVCPSVYPLASKKNAEIVQNLTPAPDGFPTGDSTTPANRWSVCRTVGDLGGGEIHIGVLSEA